MDPNIFTKVVMNSKHLISESSKLEVKRDVYEKIQNPTDYYVGIKGLRGIGKTTLLLQTALNYKKPFYFSSDAIHLKNYSVYEIISHAKANGHDAFFIDEIHFKKNWAESLKTLYDEGVRNIYFTGSSAIELTKGADLSRRAVLYELPPATFREYLSIQKGIILPPISFDKILKNRSELLPKYIDTYVYFEEYMDYGGVLYDRKEFDNKLKNSITKLISMDLAYSRDININTETDVFKIYNLISTSPSFELNYSRLASALDISKNTVKRLLLDLEKAGAIIICSPCKKGYALIRDEPKLFLPIPFTSYFNRGLMLTPSPGRLREEFFISHVGKTCYMKTKRGEKTADFMVKDKIFEIGGASKTNIQNPDYLVLDSLETAGNRIPLFLFGFLH